MANVGESSTAAHTTPVTASKTFKTAALPTKKKEKTKGPPSWSWVPLTDTELSQCAPLCTPDGKYFFVTHSSTVKICSLETGQVLSSLTCKPVAEQEGFPRPGANVTSLLLNPYNPYQLYTGSADGYIRLWDFLDSVLLESIDTTFPICRLTASTHAPGYLFVAMEVDAKVMRYTISRITLRPKESSAPRSIYQPAEIVLIGDVQGVPSSMTISPSGTWLITVAAKTIYVCSVSSPKSGFASFLSPDRITCLAFHPVEETFATGDAIGVIRLWYCLTPALRDSLSSNSNRASRQDQLATTSTLHWHSHAVGSLQYTPNGAYLMSGGEEGVLVRWQIQSGHKDFMPRLGAPVRSVVVVPLHAQREQEILVLLVDGTILLLSLGTLKLRRSFKEAKSYASTRPEPLSPSSDHAPLTINPSTGHLLLPSSHPSSIQIFSLQSNELVTELEVAPSNRITAANLIVPIEPIRVLHAKISPGSSLRKADAGEWLVTIDYRDGGADFGTEYTMKIWRWVKGAATYELNTRVERPHGRSKVTSVEWNPLGAVGDSEACTFVTAGEDGNIRMWRLNIAGDKKGYETTSWVARSTFTYRGYIPKKVQWSADASLLVVAQGPGVTLWEPTSNALLHTLSCPEIPSPQDICFTGSDGRYLVVSGHQGFVVWDLLTTKLISYFNHRTSDYTKLIPHPTFDLFAFAYPTPASSGQHATVVQIFDVNSSAPLRSYRLPFHLIEVTWVGSKRLPSTPNFSFAAVTESWAVVLVGDQIIHSLAAPTPGEGSITRADNELRRPTLFEDIFGQSAFVTKDEAPRVTTSTNAHTAKKVPLPLEVLDGPAHMLPPITTLFSTLIGGFLEVPSTSTMVEVPPPSPKGKEREVIVEDDAMDVDIDSVDIGNFNVAGQSDLTWRERVVGQKEMDSFTDLFRSQSFLASSTTAKRKPAKVTNGTPARPHTNGTASNGATNGHSKPSPASFVSPTKKSKLASVDTPSKSSTATVTGTPLASKTPSPAVGKKRRRPSSSQS